MKRSIKVESENEFDEDEQFFSEVESSRDDLLGSIIGRILKTSVSSAPTPVLARRKGVERKIADEALERRAKALIKKEDRIRRDLAHRPVPTVRNREKILRATATSAVVRLFNAIHTHQASITSEKEAISSKRMAIADAIRSKEPVVIQEPKNANVNGDIRALSKASFLSLLKMGGSKSSV